MCRDEDDGWVGVEIKRIGTIDAVEQLTRYLDCIRVDPSRAACRGFLVAQADQAAGRRARRERGIACVEVDLAVLRGEREPELTLFSVLARVEREQPLALGVDLAPGTAPAAARTARPRSRSVSMRHAPATKPSTVNVFFVVAFFLLNTISTYSGGTIRERSRCARMIESNAGRKRTGAGTPADASGARGRS